uniref:Uncharacterized protein n=1 Tax=Bactrocera latifrons TaxID=174628 RepID=A0A0K8U0R3_BACLA
MCYSWSSSNYSEELNSGGEETLNSMNLLKTDRLNGLQWQQSKVDAQGMLQPTIMLRSCRIQQFTAERRGHPRQLIAKLRDLKYDAMIDVAHVWTCFCIFISSTSWSASKMLFLFACAKSLDQEI